MRRRVVEAGLVAVVAVVVALVGMAFAMVRVRRLVILGGSVAEQRAILATLSPLVVGREPFLLRVGPLQAALREDATLATEVRTVSLTRIGLAEEVVTVQPRRPVAILANGLALYQNGMVLQGPPGGRVVVCATASPVPPAACTAMPRAGARVTAPVVAAAAALEREGLGGVVSPTRQAGVAVRLSTGAACLLGTAQQATAELRACEAFAAPGELVDATNPNAPAGLGELRVG